jgi:hypothetical protein
MYPHFGNSLYTIAKSLQQISENGVKQADSPLSIITAFSTLGAVFVALFATFWPNIHKHLNRPKLVLEFYNKEPFCRHTVGMADLGNRTITRLNSYFLRIRVRNSGKIMARTCVCKLIAIAHKNLKSLRSDFDPSVLNWVGSDIVVRNLEQGKSSVQFSKKRSVDINTEEYEYVDLLSTNDKSTKFDIQAIDRDIPRGITLDPDKDDYYFLVTAYAENAEPVSKVYKTKVGKTYDDVTMTVANEQERKKFYRLLLSTG